MCVRVLILKIESNGQHFLFTDPPGSLGAVGNGTDSIGSASIL